MKHKLKSGMTLIEVLLYIVLLTFIVGGSLVSAYNLIEGSNRSTRQAIVSEESNFIMRKIDWVLSGLPVVIAPTPGGSDSTLVVQNHETLFTLDLDSGTVRLARDVSLPLGLNSENIKVESLSFEHIGESGGKPAGVKTTFTVEGENFESVKYLRW